MEKYVYFVSYVSEEGFDSIQYQTDDPIEYLDEVIAIRDDIEEQYEVENVTILNWKLLRVCEETDD